MKKHILSILSCFLIYTCFAQSNDYTITCPENTFLGAFGCSNIRDVPGLPATREEAMAAPYNIQIEGEVRLDLRVTSEDDATIFYCETDSRMVQRDIIFGFGPGGFEGFEEVARCSFTIETIADLTAPEFIAPPNKEINCDNPEMYPDEVTFIGEDCIELDQDNAFFSDEESVEGQITTITRTWRTTDICGNISEPQQQIITVNCAPVCNLRPPVITCD